MATAEETRAAEYRRQYRARIAAARAREMALKGDAAAKAALVAKTAPLLLLEARGYAAVIGLGWAVLTEAGDRLITEAGDVLVMEA